MVLDLVQVEKVNDWM